MAGDSPDIPNVPAAPDFDDYWSRLAAANGALTIEHTIMRMSVPAFRKELRKAYERGRSDELLSLHQTASETFPDVLQYMFGNLPGRER